MLATPFVNEVHILQAPSFAFKERGATMLIPGSMVDSLNPPLALEIAGRDVARATLTPFKAAA
jgi:hypothetical protein